MLKRISVQQLLVGMFVKEFCGAWIDHPFWRSSFMVIDANEIATIQASSVKEVWIDTSKGLDVAPGAAALTQEQSDARVESRLHSQSNVVQEPQKISALLEFKRAARICQQSRKAVVSMFNEARMGGAFDATGAKQLVEEISESVSRNASALISLARLKSADDYTYMHSVAVCAMMIALARQLELDNEKVKLCGLAGLLHDLGKAVMPMEVLNKPGKLTETEFAIMKTHPLEGHKMLLASGNFDPLVLDVCLHHHEKTDGSGYPDRLKTDEISLFAKMGAVCDVYDAITSNRPYKSGWDPAESLRKMADWADGHFDPQVFQAFVRSLGIYPIGSLVRLGSGRIAVVTEQSGQSLTKPRVKVFFSTKSGMRITPEVIDLSTHGVTDKIASREDPAQWNFPDLHELWSDAEIA